MFAQLFLISVSAILIENFVLVKIIGICPFLGVSKRIDTAIGMGFSVTFVIALSSFFTYIVYTYVLVPLNLVYLETIAFILIIATLVQFIEMFLQKSMPALYNALGIYLPLITTNCAVLGATILNIDNGYNLIESVVFGFMAGAGFTLAIVIFSGIRERIENSDIPKPFKGFPIALISAALLALAFTGFQGLKLPI